MNSKLICILSLSLLFTNVSSQTLDSARTKLSHYISVIDNFSTQIPQEKVYLHFDNTSYYQGDDIWFKCYLETSELYKTIDLSKTLYVELLNPGGEIINRQVLKIENGQCHGNFTLNKLPFYSGFFEVRAYTKYMLNFGEDVIFSRIFPVFDKPKETGNFEEKNIQKNTMYRYPMMREKPEKDKRVNLKFYPEGGNLIQSVASQVAFEATDAYGNPIEITGSIINKAKEEIAHFASIHDGRGVFAYTPIIDAQHKAIINYNDKKYEFDLPTAQPRGVVLKVDNLSRADSIEVVINKNQETVAEMLGMAIINKGVPYNVYITSFSNNKEIRFKVDKTKLPSGVSWMVLFNQDGQIICDRLIFTNKNEVLDIKVNTTKDAYKPYELIDMEFSVIDKDNNPVGTTLSVSVRDGMNEVESGHNILTNLLLMSEIKGYVRNPSYYFEKDDHTHRMALDLLLMVQGWRRYSWEQMAGIKPFDLKYKLEQNIEVEGKVFSFFREKLKPNVDVSVLLSQKIEEKEPTTLMNTFVTDSLGGLSFALDIQGKWSMILSVMEKGKKKRHEIILDRVFYPMPQKYKYAEMQLSLGNYKEDIVERKKDTDATEEDLESFFSSYNDSLAKINEKIITLEEVTVIAKKRSQEKDIYKNRSTSVAFYDIHSVLDDIKDNGDYMADDLFAFLLKINRNFRRGLPDNIEILYKTKSPLFIVNYKVNNNDQIGIHTILRLEAIKSIYINENISAIIDYADPSISPIDIIGTYSCVVFIETYPEGKIPNKTGKGVRRTVLEGYSQVKEFYSPDYSTLPHNNDYRRTLYWNPSVISDDRGKARIQFYNNSRCTNFRISAETITQQGVIGVLHK